MHCNVGAYSRNSEIHYIFLTSHTLVSGHTLMLTAMAYCVLVTDMATISITITVRIQIDLVVLVIIFVLVVICLRMQRKTVEEGRFQVESDSDEDSTNAVEDEYFSTVEDEELIEPEVYALYAEFYGRLCDDELHNLDNYLKRD